MGAAHAAGGMIRTTCQSADSTIVETTTVRRHGLRPSYAKPLLPRAFMRGAGSIAPRVDHGNEIVKFAVCGPTLMICA